MHPLEQHPQFVDTIYVLDRMIMDENGAVVDAQFMGVLTSRDRVTNRISAAHHFGGVQTGVYRVMEILPDAPEVTHVYQIKAVGTRQEWLRLAKSKGPGSDDGRFAEGEVQLFSSEDQYAQALKDIHNLRSRMFRYYILAMIVSALLVVLLRVLF